MESRMDNRTQLPGLEAKELATPEDFADSLAGDLELAPIEQDEHAKKLERAGFTNPSARAEARMSDQAYWAHRNEVNSTTTDALGFRS